MPGFLPTHLRHLFRISPLKLDTQMPLLTPLVKGFPDPVIVVDHTLNIRLFNQGALDLFEQMQQGATLYSITRDSDFLEAVQKTLDNNKKNTLSFTLKKRYKRTINATLIPLPADAFSGQSAFEEEGAFLFIHLRDMSEPERLSKMRMHFIANASHELRTPLASIMGFVETLQTTARHDEKTRDHFLAIMAEQTKRMTRLIADLLSLSQLEMNTDPPSQNRVDVINTVAEVVDTLMPLAQKNRVEIKTSFPETSFHVCGQKDELVQVFQNILQNAIRYGSKSLDEDHQQAKVWISVSQLPSGKKHGPRLSITFRDNGPGIEQQHIPYLTQRFYRVDKVVSRNKGGTGLGLSIAKHIIKRHLGKLEIKSKPGKGATFTVILPQCERDCT